ncbi:hypothetical protein GCM10022225_70720 [Plantactinospora mayteni]|uniref:Uncharacterized protein n=1 Tax=Plantactinospora mayteni TaxID=566021 RepID=A0ABQ4EVV3_9ACTN|nr:hypothetical protein [Plantactinospora mayteni]GIG98745.1 hypothetical protein Pma05_53180 [Plantactinospora mayteni]
MGQWPPADDDALLRELGEALRDPGPPPEEFLAAGYAAFSWRTVDAELALAELTFDSACDPEPAGMTRSAGSARALAFHAGPVVVAIEVTGTGIVGQISPARSGRVLVRTPRGPYEEVPVDAVGFFSLGPPPSGPVQLHARTSDYAVATSWVSLR